MGRWNRYEPREKFGEPAKLEPLQIVVDGSFEHAVRDFKVLVQHERVIGIYKERQSYEKPSEKKRRKKREAEERRRLAEMRDCMMASGEWDRRQKAKQNKRQRKTEARIRREENTETLE
jgi:small subunit ribosomal protein S21